MQISDSYTPQGVGPLAPKQSAPPVIGSTGDDSSSGKKAKTDSASFSPEALAALAQSQAGDQAQSR